MRLRYGYLNDLHFLNFHELQVQIQNGAILNSEFFWIYQVSVLSRLALALTHLCKALGDVLLSRQKFFAVVLLSTVVTWLLEVVLLADRCHKVLKNHQLFDFFDALVFTLDFFDAFQLILQRNLNSSRISDGGMVLFTKLAVRRVSPRKDKSTESESKGGLLRKNDFLNLC